MRHDITMTPEELDEIERYEGQRGFDHGARVVIEHLVRLLNEPDTNDRLVFKDKKLMESYWKLRHVLGKIQ